MCLKEDTLSVGWLELDAPDEAPLEPLLLLDGEDEDADITDPLICISWPTWSLNCEVSPASW